MDKFKDDIAFVLDQSGIYKASLHAQEEMTEAEICGTNVDTLVHQACDERARLLRAMQCSGAMFDTNMQCVAYILSLKKENMIQKRNYDAEKEVLTSRLEGLTSIVESQQNTLNNQTQALTLKGMWAGMLSAHMGTGGLLSDDKEKDSDTDSDSAAIALCLLSARCASVIRDNRGDFRFQSQGTVQRPYKPRGTYSPTGVNEMYATKLRNLGVLGGENDWNGVTERAYVNESESDVEIEKGREHWKDWDRDGARDRQDRGGEAVIQLLLEKVAEFERNTSTEYKQMEKENSVLREALQIKSVLLHTVEHDRAEENEEHTRRFENLQEISGKNSEPLRMALEDSQTARTILSDRLTQSRKEVLTLTTQLNELRIASVDSTERFLRAKEQNLLSCTLSNSWKDECQRVTREYNELKKSFDEMSKRDRQDMKLDNVEMINTWPQLREQPLHTTSIQAVMTSPPPSSSTPSSYTRSNVYSPSSYAQAPLRGSERDNLGSGEVVRAGNMPVSHTSVGSPVSATHARTSPTGTLSSPTQALAPTVTSTQNTQIQGPCHGVDPSALGVFSPPGRVSYQISASQVNGSKVSASQVSGNQGSGSHPSEGNRQYINTVSPMTPVLGREGVERTYRHSSSHMAAVTPSPIAFSAGSPPDTVYTPKFVAQPLSSPTDHRDKGDNKYDNKYSANRRTNWNEIGPGRSRSAQYDSYLHIDTKRQTDSNQVQGMDSGKYNTNGQSTQYMSGKGRSPTTSSSSYATATANAALVTPDSTRKRYTATVCNQNESPRSVDRQKDTTHNYTHNDSHSNSHTHNRSHSEYSSLDKDLINEVEAAVAMINAMIPI